MVTGNKALINLQIRLVKKSVGFTLLISLKKRGTNFSDAKLSLRLTRWGCKDFAANEASLKIPFRNHKVVKKKSS
jgi:hypothetical protein